MNSKKLYYILKSVWMVVILLVMLIFMNRDYTDISAKKAQEEENTRLNIALVNEDAGVQQNNTDYNLGADYVKKIEKDVTYNWFTVSRGIAENGLKNGTYNLLVTIPSNFSSKLLDLDSPAPEKVRVNYKINANGNATLENESKSVGRKIVNDLNQQLVDLYVVSILDNLFTAQQNIEKVYKNQTSSVQEFQNVLYQPTLNFKDYLPAITSQSKNALQANDLLANTLTGHTQGTDSLVSSHQDYSSLLEKLLQDRADGNLTYADFTKQLLAASEDVSGADIADMFAQIQDTGQQIEAEFSSGGVSDSTSGQMNALNQQLADAKAAVAEQQEKLNTISDNYFRQYKEPFFESLGVNNVAGSPKVTLGDVLTKAGKDYAPANETSISANYKKRINEHLALLPFRSMTFDLNPQDDIFRYDKPPYGDGQPFNEFQEKFNKINAKIAELNENIDRFNAENEQTEAYLSLNRDPAEAAETSYYKAIKAAYDDLLAQRSAILTGKSGSFKIDTVGLATEAQLVVTDIPAGITLTIPQLTNGPIEINVPYPITTNSKLTVNYTFTEEFNEAAENLTIPFAISQPEKTREEASTFSVEVAAPESEATSETTTSSTEIEKTRQAPAAPQTYAAVLTQSGFSVSWNQSIDTSAFLAEDYQAAKRAYSEAVGRALELYDNVIDDLTFYENYQFEQYDFLKLDLTEAFERILNETFLGGDYKAQTEHLEALRLQAENLEAQSGVVGTKLSEVLGVTQALNNDVAQQSERISQAQQNLMEVVGEQSKVDSFNSQTDSSIESAHTTLQTLFEQSKAIKEASEMNVKEAENVKSVFTTFDEEVNTAQKNGEELSSNADVIMENLNKELADNSDFVSAFIKVLNNAQKDGVPNNTLLEFIANPVNGNAEATIKTTEVNEPFTWILIMYTLSLFVAYLFATQPLVRKVKDTFKREQLWFKDNVMETIMLTISAVGIGLVLGILSISELQIVKESQIVWIMMVVLFMLIFSLLNHYALKQFHIAGFGFSLFLFISYVFVTNAIGKTKGNNPMVDLIRSINPLSLGENNLADILANNALNIVHIILYLLAIAALFAFNMFIWKPRRKVKEVVK
jgi:type VII secretion EsaA-like protein